MTQEPEQHTPLQRVTFRLPEDLYEAIKQLSKEETRPINSQTIVLLREAIAARQASRTEPD